MAAGGLRAHQRVREQGEEEQQGRDRHDHRGDGGRDSGDQRGHQEEVKEEPGAHAEALVDAHGVRVSGKEPGGGLYRI